MFFHQHPSCRELCRRHQQMSVLSQYLMKIEMKMMVFLHFPKNAVKFRIFFLWYFKNEKNSLVSCFLLKFFFKSWKQKKFLWKKQELGTNRAWHRTNLLKMTFFKFVCIIAFFCKGANKEKGIRQWEYQELNYLHFKRISLKISG